MNKLKCFLVACCLSLLAAPALAEQPVRVWSDGAPVGAANPLPVAPSAPSGTTAVNVTQVSGVAVSAANPLPSQLSQGNAALSATNGVFSNILQGNAVLSTTNPIFAAPNGVAQASITNTTAAVLDVDTTVTLAAASTHVTVKTDTGAAAIFIDLAGGTATSADFKIDGGGGYTYVGAPISSFHYIGASATGNISVCAN